MPVPPPTPAVPFGAPSASPALSPAAPHATVPPLPADLARMFGPFDLGTAPAEPCTPSAAPTIPSSNWLEQQQLEEELKGILTDVTDARLVDLMADDDAVTAGGAAQSSAALEAPVSVGLEIEPTTEAIPADVVAGDEAIGLHGIPPTHAEPETDAGLTVAQHEHVTTAGVQQAVNHIEPTLDPEWLTALYCNLHEDGKERQAPALPTSPTPESLGHGLGQGSMTPAHQALHVARQYMQIPHTNAELCQFVRTLAIELGASRKEAGTGGNKVAPSPNEVPAVACCKLLHDPKGNTAFVCRYPGCEKSYASRDAVRKHCRIHHLQWLRTLERVTTHEEEMVEVTLPVRTLKVQAVYEQRRDVLAVLVSLLASRDDER